MPRRGITRARRAGERTLIAILPFENLSGSSAQDYFAEGLTEEMISQIGRLSPETLGVIARTTVMQYRAPNRPTSIPRKIAEELNVDYVMEGSVRCEGDRVRVTAQLIDGRDQTHLWAGSYDQPMRSILSLQRDLAADIGRADSPEAVTRRGSPVSTTSSPSIRMPTSPTSRGGIC